ncbi:MAG: zinc ribbon domain-containing protein [Desulfobacterales bacterium]
MKHKSFILLLFFILMATAPAFAQNPASLIDSLNIEIWPDYDKASVLVLLTGALPGDTPLPAAVTLPLPDAVQLNAVARIDSRDGSMKDDISWSFASPDKLRFITPDLRFRVEYYFPYTVDKNKHSFDFTWLAAATVNNLHLRVQRPLSAGALKTEPDAANVATSGDGFEYHTFPSQAVPAGQPFSLHVVYDMAAAQLSAARLPPANTGTQPAGLPAASAKRFDISWALAAMVAGGLIVIGALIWQFAARRRVPDMGNPDDSRIETKVRGRFCPNCGGSVDQDDRFCRGCGSEL